MMKRTLTLLLLGCMLAVTCSACEDAAPDTEPTWEEETETTNDPNELPTLSPEEIEALLEANAKQTSPVQETDPPETDASGTAVVTTDFGTAVYLSKREDDSERFFFFYGNNNGAYLEQANGTGMSFTYEMTGEDSAVFHFGDTTSQATIFHTESSTELVWQSGEMEVMTLLPNNPTEAFHFYNNEVLCARALNVYEQKTGYRPNSVEAWTNFDGLITIHLYDVLSDGHEATSDWYNIDRYTGIGTNLLNERINLSDIPDSELPTEMESFTGETETAETTEPTEEPAIPYAWRR